MAGADHIRPGHDGEYERMRGLVGINRSVPYLKFAVAGIPHLWLCLLNGISARVDYPKGLIKQSANLRLGGRKLTFQFTRKHTELLVQTKVEFVYVQTHITSDGAPHKQQYADLPLIETGIGASCVSGIQRQFSADQQQWQADPPSYHVVHEANQIRPAWTAQNKTWHANSACQS